jgi:hypothetical protein
MTKDGTLFQSQISNSARTRLGEGGTSYQVLIGVRLTTMEQVEIAELAYNTLIDVGEFQKLDQFLSPTVQWVLSTADFRTAGEEAPPNALKFFGKEGCQQLALYFRESLNVVSGALTGCICHHQLVFVFGKVQLRTSASDQLAETNIAAKLTFHLAKIVKGQIRISWPLSGP